jgi:phosphate transport system protein
MSEHTYRQFDVELEAIRSRVLQMGGLVEQQVDSAMNGLETGDMLLIDQVVNNDQRVNRFEVEIDEACNNLIAKRQPTAGDLRMVMTVVKTITDLERIGDEAKKIARRAKSLYSNDHAINLRVRLRPAVDQALDMLRASLDSFARVDVSAAADVHRQDKKVDEEFRGVIRQLITFMMEDPRTISACLEMVWVAKSIERIGDHSKNMSEYVVYMVKGRDVRHVSVEELEREVKSGR